MGTWFAKAVSNASLNQAQSLSHLCLLTPVLFTPLRAIVALHWLLARSITEVPHGANEQKCEKGCPTSFFSAKAIVGRLKNGSAEEQEEAADELSRYVLEGSEENQEAFVKAGAVVPLVGLLWARPTLAAKVIRALATLAFNNPDNQALIVRKGAVPALVASLQSSYDDLQEAAVIALANIVYESTEIQDYVASSGAVKPLVGLLRSDDVCIQENAAMTLAFLASTNNSTQTMITAAGAFDNLLPLLESSSEAVREKALLLTSLLPEPAAD